MCICTFFERFGPMRAKHLTEPSSDLPILRQPRPRACIPKLVLCKLFARAPLAVVFQHALLHDNKGEEG